VTRVALVLATTQAYSTIREAVHLGALLADDAGLHEAEQAMWEASRSHKQDKARVDTLPQERRAAEAEVRMAERHAWLARERQDLLEALAEVQAQPVPDPSLPDAYRRYAAWKQTLDIVRRDISNVLAAAGV
jgi:hypothetical protein